MHYTQTDRTPLARFVKFRRSRVLEAANIQRDLLIFAT